MSQNAESVCAVLDLGSNSFHLLIGRLDGGRIVTVDRRKDTVRLAPVSYTHLRAHETVLDLVCRLLLEKKTHATNSSNTSHHINNDKAQ